jgi:hypothetical protein
VLVAYSPRPAPGTFDLAAGESWGSFLLELPFWLGFFGVPAAVLGMLGGGG